MELLKQITYAIVLSLISITISVLGIKYLLRDRVCKDANFDNKYSLKDFFCRVPFIILSTFIFSILLSPIIFALEETDWNTIYISLGISLIIIGGIPTYQYISSHLMTIKKIDKTMLYGQQT